MQRQQRVDGRTIDHAFVIGPGIDVFAHAHVAEIFHQHITGGCVIGQNDRRAHAVAIEPQGRTQKRRRVFAGRRRMHQHCHAAIGLAHTEIAAKRGVTGQSIDLGTGPASALEKRWRVFGNGQVHGPRSSQCRPGSTMARRPLSRISMSIDKQPGSCAKPPAFSGHSASSAAPRR